MPEIIEFIQALVDKGYAYEADGDVYFHTKAFPSYGQLSGQSIDDLRSGARIDVGEQKRDPLDFALWKKAKDGEVNWEAPWSSGRPVGILSVQQWLRNTSVTRLTSMRVVKTLRFHTMKMKWLNQKP